MYIDAQREYFIQRKNLTWVDARNYCQVQAKPEIYALTGWSMKLSYTTSVLFTKADMWEGIQYGI